MLVRLLALISDTGRVASTAEIARRLGTGEGLLLRMIEDATRMGYLRTVDGECGSACSACSARSSCALGSRSGVWILTEKGRRVLAGSTANS